MTNFPDHCTDFCRAGMATTVDMMTATVEGAERLRTQQLTVIHQVLAENAGLAARINDTKNLDDLIALGATLAGTQFRNVLGYWSGIHRVVAENQVAIQERGQAQFMEMQRHFAASLEAAVNGGPEPMVEAVKATVSAISTGYSTMARAAAETARLAAVQVATADAGIRPAAATIHKSA